MMKLGLGFEWISVNISKKSIIVDEKQPVDESSMGTFYISTSQTLVMMIWRNLETKKAIMNSQIMGWKTHAKDNP